MALTCEMVQWCPHYKAWFIYHGQISSKQNLMPRTDSGTDKVTMAKRKEKTTTTNFQ